ncbi:MAG: ethanolamine ammonia-lyase reactivating factor EutA [Actinomycetota bacterium]|nr:ethanolamine ammonia-lyase reactivating factor EutA [Actinomycetota bacterium]
MSNEKHSGGHDHDHGHDHALESGGDYDHDFYGEGEFIPFEDNPIWQQENVALRSVGIDIGSSGTQVVFSELKLQRNGAGLATRYVVIERTCLFQSAVSFTPFTDGLVIDGPALGAIIDDAYGAAGVRPEEIDTGIVILTGEALRRENAESIAMVVSERAGDFVCATAGHHMEATLAAYGSGAVQASSESGQRILNIDIGGGTTKLSLIESGRILATAALHVGGRLIVVGCDGRVLRLEDAAIAHARSAGINLNHGGVVSQAELDSMARVMADILVSAVSPTGNHSAVTIPYLTEPISDLSGIEGVIFSGGVGEYVYGTEDRDFGDLGRRLGAAIRSRLLDGSIPYPLLPATARIRATALGASEFSVQLSGNTYYISDEERLLPRRNLQVIRPIYTLDEEIDVNALASAVQTRVASFAVPGDESDFVLAMSWMGELSYGRLHAMAEAIVLGLSERISAGRPVLLAFDADMGKALGSMLRSEFDVMADILVVDGLNLLDFDYIDLGHPLQPSMAIPVTIKSLVF